MMASRIVLLGPPGSGKGTQAGMIEQACGIPHISTGDMLREAAAKETELGRRAKRYMDEGKLVPDEVMASIVEDRLQWPDAAAGFILDGYPRTVEQALELDRFLGEQGSSLDIVLSLEVAHQQVIERLSNRRVCRDCGRPYNLITNPPREEGRCDQCGGELGRREDDSRETIAKRLNVYEVQTEPLKAYYGRSGILVAIHGSGSVGEIQAEIASHVKCANE